MHSPSSQKYGFVIVEDDPYWRCASRASSCVVVRQRDLARRSQASSCRLRVGYAVAPTWARAPREGEVRRRPVHVELGAGAAERARLERGWLSDHIEALVRGGAHARALEILAARVGERFAFTRPDGGMLLWGRLADGRSATELLPKAVEQGMAFVPGEPFYSGPPDVSTLRMSFATASPEELDEGVRRFAAALNS